MVRRHRRFGAGMSVPIASPSRGIGVAVPQGRHAPGRRVLDTPGSAQLCGGAPVVSGRGG